MSDNELLKAYKDLFALIQGKITDWTASKERIDAWIAEGNALRDEIADLRKTLNAETAEHRRIFAAIKERFAAEGDDWWKQGPADG